MKAFKVMIAAAVLISALMIGGCFSKYSYDFAKEFDLGEAEDAWVKYPADRSFVFHTSRGIRLEDGAGPARIRTPIYFTGDFKVTVEFYLELDSSHVGGLAFMLSDDTWPDLFNNAFFMPIYYICSVDEELHVADWQKLPYIYTELKDDDLPLNSLNRNGANKLVLTKSGNQITVVFNDSAADTYGPYTISNYTPDRFYLTFAGDLEFSPTGNYGVFITRVKVQ